MKVMRNSVAFLIPVILLGCNPTPRVEKPVGMDSAQFIHEIDSINRLYDSMIVIQKAKEQAHLDSANRIRRQIGE